MFRKRRESLPFRLSLPTTCEKSSEMSKYKVQLAPPQEKIKNGVVTPKSSISFSSVAKTPSTDEKSNSNRHVIC